MIRTIDDFHQDEVGDWVAELSCLHTQHVRHRPPFWDRAWVTEASGRDAHLGSDIYCPLCDRAELPRDLVVVRTAGPFDQSTVPAGLQRSHRIAARTWGLLRVLEGSLGFTMETSPTLDRRLEAGDTQPIPPVVAHAVHVQGPARFAVDFLAPRDKLDQQGRR